MSEYVEVAKQFDAVIARRESGLAIATVNGSAPQIALTEDNIATHFASLYRGRQLYNHTSGTWLFWNGCCWQKEETQLVFDQVRAMTRGLNRQGKARWATARLFAAVEKIATSDRAFAKTADDFDTDPWLLTTPGGTVDLRTGKLKRNRPDAMITKSTLISPQPGRPARWLRFLQETTGGDQELIDFLQRLLGYSLTGITSEHTLVFIYGPGGNGKGVFINVVLRILAHYAQMADARTFTLNRHDRHPTELAALRGARLVAASETEQGAEWAEARIKSLTGGDVIRARFMRQDEFEYRPQFKLVVVGNFRPRLRDVGEAMRRRLRIIPFEQRPATVNPNLEADLLNEEAGQILQWMIDGCLLWQKDGLPLPRSIRDATNDYFESQDSFGEWLAGCTETGERHYETPGALYRSWSEYCTASGDKPGSQVAFADSLKRRGFTNTRKSFGRVWLGLHLKQLGHVGS